MEQQRILVVEDDRAIRQGVVDALECQGYATLQAGDGATGMKAALETDWDLLLLDLVLPECGGLDILRKLRSERGALPVIILTARGDEDDRVKGLALGADDYVVKPFSVRELIARVEAVLRRSPERPAEPRVIRVPGAAVDLGTNEVRFDAGERCGLSQKEAALLEYLAGATGRAVSREELLSRIWHVNPSRIETRTVDMHIARLRTKLRDVGSEPRVIATVRGKGYMFIAPETVPE
jgi:DNA-binding response OmpR family regulator